jgi:hypothetical protein
MVNMPLPLLAILLLLVGGCDPGPQAKSDIPAARTQPRVLAVRSHPDGPVEGYRIETSSRCRSGRFPVHIEVGLDGTIRRVSVPSYPHRYGRGVMRKSFLRQFAGQPLGGASRQKVDVVSGATSSCRGLARAVARSAGILSTTNPLPR